MQAQMHTLPRVSHRPSSARTQRCSLTNSAGHRHGRLQTGRTSVSFFSGGFRLSFTWQIENLYLQYIYQDRMVSYPIDINYLRRVQKLPSNLALQLTIGPFPFKRFFIKRNYKSFCRPCCPILKVQVTDCTGVRTMRLIQ